MHHATYLRRCLELAENGRGKVQTNPMVGCVIVRCQVSGNRCQVLGEGWHEEFGAQHAEVCAINNACLQTTNYKLQTTNSTLYVNLEPCYHTGKQPPCTDAIIAAGIHRVVFGARDPLNGGSACPDKDRRDVLSSRGIEVIGPVMEAECRRFNKGFFSLIEQGRPWVTVKKALRRDGSVPSEHVTNAQQDAWAHERLRATHDAILVGAGTILADNPGLNVRFPVGALHATPLQPRRIILDPLSCIPKTATVLTDNDAQRTIVIREKLPISELLERLKEEGIASLLVEGGPTVWKAFEESGCIDEIVTLTQQLRTSELQNL